MALPKHTDKIEYPEINRISVAGFKSIYEEQHIDLGKLTILAGANSSGKSSMLQPLLLIKQTLDAPYDPGPLLLNGPHLKFTSVDQILSRSAKGMAKEFKFAMRSRENTYEVIYEREPIQGFQIKSCGIASSDPKRTAHLMPDMSVDQIEQFVSKKDSELYGELSNIWKKSLSWHIGRQGPFLLLELKLERVYPIFVAPFDDIVSAINGVIHLPGLRGNPERAYPVTAVGEAYPGTFESYTASIIAHWQNQGDKQKLKALAEDLRKLGLTWHVEAHRINDAQVELRVGRLPNALKGGTSDLVNIADVGFGVSQTLPVVTALHAAAPGQIVYLEQPEIHLHPRAQVAMAEVLADAAKRGVCVIVETHSRLHLLSIQTLIAEQRLSPDLVSLNWFERDKEGLTHVTQAAIDEYGRFGDWPEDFDDVSLTAENRYLNAIDKRMAI